jgi:hypothetical protein
MHAICPVLRLDIEEASMWKVVIALIVLMASPAYAQHNHDEGHPDYREWASGRTWNCCNEKDCGDLNDDEVRETPTGTEVLVKTKGNAPKWCPVTKQHYLTKGKSPDWNKPHACIVNSTYYDDPCKAFLCYTGKGLW